MPKVRKGFLPVFFFIFSYLYCETVEIVAPFIETNRTVTTASGGIVVYYQDTFIRSDQAVYDKGKQLLSLEGNVTFIGYLQTKQRADHVDINLTTRQINFKQLFFTNRNDIWLAARQAKREDENLTLGSGCFSSCEPDDPIWRVHFGASKYDAKEEYLRLYHTIVYLFDIPVLYTPYLGLPTDNRRKSGLLFPRLGYTVIEGLVYEQPLFWAISDSMDLEIAPQIRTDRSIGAYATFRFVDSPVSFGKLRIGYFKDNEAFVQRYNLANDQHYGLQFVYDRNELLATKFGRTYKDGLYIDVTLLNDIDYLNLQKSGGFGIFGQSPIQQSIVNYYIDNNRWYGGINAKYFIDTRLPDNDETIQTLPSVQLHRYISHLLRKNFIYGFDFQTRNLYRKKGMTLRQAEIRIPIEWTTSWFDNYLSLTLGESLYVGSFWFDNDDTRVYDRFHYINHVHYVKLFSDLAGRFDQGVHVIQPSISYNIPGNERSEPVDWLNLVRLQPQAKALMSVGIPEERLVLSLNHYFYDETMQLRFFQRLRQYYYPKRIEKLSNLENEMGYVWNRWQLYNNLIYAFEYGKIRESSSFLTYNDTIFTFRIGHTFKQNVQNRDDIISNDLQLDVRYKVTNQFALTSRWYYDLEEKGINRWIIGGSYEKDCWSIDARVGADIRPQPVATNGEVQSVQEYTFFVQLNFKPFAVINGSNLNGVLNDARR